MGVYALCENCGCHLATIELATLGWRQERYSHFQFWQARARRAPWAEQRGRLARPMSKRLFWSVGLIYFRMVGAVIQRRAWNSRASYSVYSVNVWVVAIFCVFSVARARNLRQHAAFSRLWHSVKLADRTCPGIVSLKSRCGLRATRSTASLRFPRSKIGRRKSRACIRLVSQRFKYLRSRFTSECRFFSTRRLSFEPNIFRGIIDKTTCRQRGGEKL